MVLKSWEVDSQTTLKLYPGQVTRVVPRKDTLLEVPYTFQQVFLRPFPIIQNLEIVLELMQAIVELNPSLEGLHPQVPAHLHLIRQLSHLNFDTGIQPLSEAEYPFFRLRPAGIEFLDRDHDTGQLQPLNSLYFAGPRLGKMSLQDQESIRRVLLQEIPGMDHGLIFPLLDWEILRSQHWHYSHETQFESQFIHLEGGYLMIGGGTGRDRHSGGGRYICANFIRYYGQEAFKLEVSAPFHGYYKEIFGKISAASRDGNQICLAP
ncbi:MAG: hypothetical protein H6581_04870 [Bacteroidia bacterium]|nr:hypothetical protein [Bacteroidia bacterium]